MFQSVHTRGYPISIPLLPLVPYPFFEGYPNLRWGNTPVPGGEYSSLGTPTPCPGQDGVPPPGIGYGQVLPRAVRLLQFHAGELSCYLIFSSSFIHHKVLSATVRVYKLQLLHLTIYIRERLAIKNTLLTNPPLFKRIKQTTIRSRKLSRKLVAINSKISMQEFLNNIYISISLESR